ncbi:MAG: hypothetical protein FWG09_07570, partial [Synergistaceae bacterium]|nr:hypothetical protein [Synergistaceae bacterium]
AVAEEQAASSREITLSVKAVSDSIRENSEATSEMKKELASEAEISRKMGSEVESFMLLAQELLEKISKYRLLSNEELADQILEKIQVHKDFCHKLFAIAETCELHPIQINSHNCGLGVLMTTSLPPRGYEHWWEKIHGVHDEYHGIGAKLIEVLKSENKSMDVKRREARELANKGEVLSKVVIKLLEDAAHDIRHAKLQDESVRALQVRK